MARSGHESIEARVQRMKELVKSILIDHNVLRVNGSAQADVLCSNTESNHDS